MIRVSAFRSLPSMVQGYARDISVRWALEEIGFQYETRLLGPEDRVTGAYLAQHPFGQIPVYEEDGLVLFESGAIVLHIAEKSNVLIPKELKAQGLVKSWMFAAMNTIDPLVKNFEQIEYGSADEEWAKLRRSAVIEAVQKRLLQLSKWLEDRDYLVGQFSAADILMTMSLRNLGPCDLFLQMPVLVNYVKRCEARVAFQAALAAHLSVYR